MSEAVAGQKFALPTDGGTGVRIFGEPSRVRDTVRTVATSLPESPAPLVTSGSGSELRRGGGSRLFLRRFMARIEFYMHKNNGEGTKKLSGQSTDFHDDDKFKAG